MALKILKKIKVDSAGSLFSFTNNYKENAQLLQGIP